MSAAPEKPTPKFSRESIERLRMLGKALAENDTATISKFKDGLIGGAQALVEARKQARLRAEKEERRRHRERSRG